MKIYAIDKNNKKRKKSEVISISEDGWVVTKDGAFGDLGEDCKIDIDISSFLKNFRNINGLTQQQMAWIMGVSRTSYLGYEAGKNEVKLKDFLCLSMYRRVPAFSFFEGLLNN